MKKLLFVLAASLIVGSVSASELYWMMGPSGSADELVDGKYVTKASSPYGTDDVDYTWSTMNIYANGLEGDKIMSISAGDLYDNYGYGKIVNFDSYSAVESFVIELVDANRTENAIANVAATELLHHISIDNMNPPSAGAYQFSGFTTQAVPEPTTGLLMLFGLAGLALRRRRA